jgi:glycosyltransferase involved in cell wall biosynthesis
VRILHTPYNIANDAWSLSRGQRALGARADVATISGSPLVAPPDVDLAFRRRGAVTRQLGKARFVAGAICAYDVFHFAFAASILDYGDGALCLLDVRLADAARRCVAMTFHGCDVRPLQPGGCRLCAAGCSRARARQRLETVRRHADLLYVTTPDLLVAVPAARLLPPSMWAIADMVPAPPSTSGPLRVVHAPSDRTIKGTAAVVAAVDRLREDGFEVELTLIENLPREKALLVYRGADVAVDQLRIGWYGVFAIEMMALGKPVVAHIAPGLAEASGLPAPPVLDADEGSVERVLRDLAGRRDELPELGARSRAFALERHDAVANAARVLADYERVLAAAARSRRRRRS